MAIDPKVWLEEWVEQKVFGVPHSEQKRAAKDTYVPVAIAQANEVGITRRELEAAAGGNLQKYLEGAIEDKYDELIKKNTPKS